jgi:hypothetical protein
VLCAVQLWQVETGTLLSTLHGHKDMVLSACFSHDGSVIFSAGADHTVRVWSVEAARSRVGQGSSRHMGAGYSFDDYVHPRVDALTRMDLSSDDDDGELGPSVSVCRCVCVSLRVAHYLTGVNGGWQQSRRRRACRWRRDSSRLCCWTSCTAMPTSCTAPCRRRTIDTS